jgi:citrate lyase subunit beta/citryl-CoA lyase
VELYYGDSIREQILRGLSRLGVTDAVVTVEDRGALPFVIDARLEAAARGAGLGEGKQLLPERKTAVVPSSRDRLRRSRLYLPGSQPKFFVNAALHAPDAVILDLEDSVHPAEKEGARLLVRNALHAVDFGSCERMVRVNQLPLGLQDLAEIVPAGPHLILIPKVESPEEVVAVDEAAGSLVGEGERPWLMPILESALGVERALAIATASPRVAALTIGLEDYTADLGVVKTREGDESLYARQRLVNAARAADVQAIDSVYGDFEDAEGLLAYGRRSRTMGFEGMGCIHPRQIPVIHDAFSPGAAEIEKALAVVRAFREAEEKGLGVVSLGSKMIDPPVVERAVRLLATARRMGLVTDEAGGDA